MLRFNWGQRKISSCKFFENAVQGCVSGHHLWFSQRSQCFLTSCSGLNFGNIYTSIYILTLWICWKLVVFIFWQWSVWYWYNAFRPDMTYEEDWALKDNYFLTYSPINLAPSVNDSSQKENDSDLSEMAVTKVVCLVYVCWLANHGLSVKI